MLLKSAPAKKMREQDWDTPKRCHNKVLLNRLGLQVARAIGFELKFRIRKLFIKSKENKSDFTRKIERDGYVVIKDFLSADDFEKLRGYYYTSLEGRTQPTEPGPKLIAPVVSNPKNGKKDDIPFELFAKNPILNEIIENGTAHRQNILPLIRLHHYWIEEEDLGVRETALTDELHYDVPLKNFRGFFYVEKCDSTNAAFEFAAGTHKFGLKRLYMEYVDSLVQSRARQGRPDVKVQPILDRLQRLLRSEPKPLEAPGNSLIIFNTMGLHRRGRFSKVGTREAVLLDYRYLDTAANYKSYSAPLSWLKPR